VVVGTLKISLYIHNQQSLKEKRKVVKSIVSKVHHRFNASIGEVGSNDKWQFSRILILFTSGRLSILK